MRLYPRMVLDYDLRDLIQLLWSRKLKPRDLDIINARLASGRPFAVALSVRTAFDRLLSLLPAQTGDEIIMSGITIPGMAHIARHHGYRVRVADVDRATLMVSPSELRRLICARTRLFVFAPLFGSYTDLSELAALCREHNILLVEDAAQAWDGAYRGSPQADVVLFSFGVAKTATALGGAVAVFRQQELVDRFREAEAKLPAQTGRWLPLRILKYALLLPLRPPAVLGAFHCMATSVGIDMESILGSITKGFPGPELMAQIRHRLPVPVWRLLARKLEQHAGAEERKRRAETFIDLLDPAIAVAGRQAPNHSFWLTAVVVDRPRELVRRLIAAGFDGTQGSSSLAPIVDDETGQPAPRAAALVASLVYIPLSRFTGAKELARMAAIVNEHAQSAGETMAEPAL